MSTCSTKENLHDANDMRKRCKLLLFLLCGVVCIALVHFLSRKKEPTYQGKSLSKWVALCTRETWRDQVWGTNTAEHVEAIHAIHHIGTNALPLLLTLIDDPPRGLWQQAGDLSERLPERITRSAAAHWFRQQHQHIVLVADDSRSLSKALGPIATPIIPDLIQRLSSTNWTGRRDLALIALLDVGPDERIKSAAPVIAKYLTNSDPVACEVAVQMLLTYCLETFTNAPAR